jgi:glycosyltransferase involved in cell wall biosynthesis
MLDFSIIIPTYNNLDLLKRALASVLYQKDVNFEIIIVDDSNNDKIEIYLEKLQSTLIKYKKNTPCRGAVFNWNYGISLAKGRIVNILHHDECYLDAHHQLKYILNSFNHGNNIVIGNIYVQNMKGEGYYLRFPHFFKKFVASYFPSFFFFYNFIGPVSCVFLTNNLVQKFNPELKWLVDVEWYYRILKKEKVFFDAYITFGSLIGHIDKITDNINIKAELDRDTQFLRKKYGSFSTVNLFLFLKNISSLIIKAAPKKSK